MSRIRCLIILLTAFFGTVDAFQYKFCNRGPTPIAVQAVYTCPLSRVKVIQKEYKIARGGAAISGELEADCSLDIPSLKINNKQINNYCQESGSFGHPTKATTIMLKVVGGKWTAQEKGGLLMCTG